VLFEEKGGNPDAITIATSMPQQVCSHVSESHPFPLSFTSWNRRGSLTSKPPSAPLSLECADGQQISQISFASYGTPSGDCGGFTLSFCHANTSFDVLSKVSLTNLAIESNLSERAFIQRTTLSGIVAEEFL